MPWPRPSSRSGQMSCRASRTWCCSRSTSRSTRPSNVSTRSTRRSASSTPQQSQLATLRAEQTNATTTLAALQGNVIDDQTTTQPQLTAALKNSEVLNVVALPRPRLKPLVTYGLFGLIAGLAVGLAIIIIRAIVSDRLRRRDDIAYALDAPVKLSVGTLPARRRPPIWPGRAAKRDIDMRRVVAHLRSAVPRSTYGPAGLAIVAVDNAPVVAQAVVALAASYAGQGNQVVAADLSSGADMAHQLRVKRPGAHAVSHNGVSFTIVVPDSDDAALVGPLRAVTSAEGPRKPEMRRPLRITPQTFFSPWSPLTPLSAGTTWRHGQPIRWWWLLPDCRQR